MTPEEHRRNVMKLRYTTPCREGRCEVCDERRAMRWQWVEENHG